MNNGTPIVEFRDVTFSYSREAVLFRNMSLKLVGGGFYLIQGPSGSGKSTFLRLMNRLEEPLGGHLLFQGRRLTSYAPPVLRREILYLQQTPTPVDATVRGNLLRAFSFKGNRDLVCPEDAVLRARLDDFLLNDVRMETDARTLSAGQLQRLCIIRGLLLAPKIVLLDEPSSALDDTSARVVEDTAERLCTDGGLTVLMVSHRGVVPRRVPCRVLEIRGTRVEERR